MNSHKKKHLQPRSRKRLKDERIAAWRHRERYQGRPENNRPRSEPLPPGLLEQWKPKGSDEPITD